MPSSTKRPASSPTVPSFPTSTFGRDEAAAASQRPLIHDIFPNDVSSSRSTRTQQERLSLSRAKTRSREDMPKRISSVPTTPRKPPPTLESLERAHGVSSSKTSLSNRVTDGSRIPSSSIPRPSAMATTSSPSRTHRHISISSPGQVSNDHPRAISTSSIPIPALPPRIPSRGPSASSRPSTSTFGSQSVSLDQRRRAASSSTSPNTDISKKSSYPSLRRPMPPPHGSPNVSSLPASSSSSVNGAGGAYTSLKSSIPMSASPSSASPLSSSSASPSSPYTPMRFANPPTRSMSAPRPYRPAPLSLSASTTTLPSSSPYGGYVSDSGIHSDDGDASDAGIGGGGGGTPLAVDMKRLWSKPSKSGSGGGSSSIISNSSEASLGSISLSSVAAAATKGAQLQQTRPRRVSSPIVDNSSGHKGVGKHGAGGSNVPSPLASAGSGSTARKSSIPVRPVTADNATNSSNYNSSSLLSFPRTTPGLGSATVAANTIGIPSVSRKPKPAALNLLERQQEKSQTVAYNAHQQQPGLATVTSTSRAHVTASPVPVHVPPPPPPTSSPSAREKEGGAPRQRNVLRRKSSRSASAAAAGVKSPSATPTAASFQPVTPSKKTGSSSAPSSDSGHGHDGRSAEKSALTPARALAEAYKQQERRRMELETMSSASSSVSSSPLPSPGGTRQKQKQREYPSSSSTPGAVMDNGGDLLLSSSPLSASEALSHQPARTNDMAEEEARNAAQAEDEAEDEESKQREREPMPYYTVLGSSTGHLVAVGGPEDDMWNLNLDTIWSPDEQRKAIRAAATAAANAGNGGGVGKMLTRKVSARWRRTTTGGEVLAEEGGGGGSHNSKKSFDSKVAAMAARGKKQSDPTPDRWADDLWGRPSMQAALHERERGRPSTTISSGARPSGEMTTGVPNVGRKVKEEEERKGKIWRLMKRLSTGGLRDKYHAFDEPPPVPALPKQYDKSNGNGGSGDSVVTASAATVPNPSGSASPNGLFSRFMQSRPPSSPAAGATTVQMPSPTSVDKPSPPPKIQTAMGRPSTATRSSSPVSSDVASSKFFQPPRSNRSSSSSYGDEVLPPPLPKSNSNAQSPSSVPLGKHIVPPSELNAMQTPLSSSPPVQHWSASSPSSQGSRSPRTQQTRRTASQPAWLVQPLSEDAPPSLPLPPRRPATKRSSSSSLTFQQQQREILSNTPNGTGSTNSKQKSRSSSTRGRQEISFPSSSSSEGHASLVSLPSQLTVPPPRPRKSSRRSYAPQSLSSPPSSEAIAVNAQQQQFLDNDDMSNDNIRDMTWAEFGGRPVGKSHNTTLSTSTVRQFTRDRSVSPPITSPSLDGHRDGRARTMSPPKKTMMVFRSLSRDDSPRKVMSEKEKADRWDDLLQMSERAGGTLHLGTGQELLSDQMSIISNSRFSRVEENFR